MDRRGRRAPSQLVPHRREQAGAIPALRHPRTTIQMPGALVTHTAQTTQKAASVIHHRQVEALEGMKVLGATNQPHHAELRPIAQRAKVPKKSSRLVCLTKRRACSSSSIATTRSHPHGARARSSDGTVISCGCWTAYTSGTRSDNFHCSRRSAYRSTAITSLQMAVFSRSEGRGSRDSQMRWCGIRY